MQEPLTKHQYWYSQSYFRFAPKCVSIGPHRLDGSRGLPYTGACSKQKTHACTFAQNTNVVGVRFQKYVSEATSLKSYRSISDPLLFLTVSFLSAAGLVRADVTPIGPDATTQGSWNGKYGQDGFLMANGPSQSPSYGSASVSGAATFTW